MGAPGALTCTMPSVRAVLLLACLADVGQAFSLHVGSLKLRASHVRPSAVCMAGFGAPGSKKGGKKSKGGGGASPNPSNRAVDSGKGITEEFVVQLMQWQKQQKLLHKKVFHGLLFE